MNLKNSATDKTHHVERPQVALTNRLEWTTL